MAAERSCAGAGGVDQHEVECLVQVVGQGGEVARYDLDRSSVGAVDAAPQLVELWFFRVHGHQAAVLAERIGEGQRLSTGAGACVQHGFARLGARCERDELAAFVLKLDGPLAIQRP